MNSERINRLLHNMDRDSVILERAEKVFGIHPEWRKIDNFLRIKLWGEPKNPIWEELFNLSTNNDEAFKHAINHFQQKSEERSNKARRERKETLKKRWRDATRRKKMSQKDFCEKYEIHESTFSRWLNDETNESLKTEKAVQSFLADVRSEEMEEILKKEMEEEFKQMRISRS